MNAEKIVESFAAQIADYAKRVAILEGQLAEARAVAAQLQTQLAEQDGNANE